MALVTRTRLDGRDKSSVVCSHCKRTGHEDDTCFALHGYLEWWGDRLRSDGKSVGRGGQSSARGGGRGTKGTHPTNAAKIASTCSTVTDRCIATARTKYRPVANTSSNAGLVKTHDDREDDW